MRNDPNVTPGRFFHKCFSLYAPTDITEQIHFSPPYCAKLAEMWANFIVVPLTETRFLVGQDVKPRYSAAKP